MSPIVRGALLTVLAAVGFASVAGCPADRSAATRGAPSGGSKVAAEPKLDPPSVPDPLKPSDGERVAVRAAAHGVQIYECQVADKEAYTWKLVGPDADLTDDTGKRIGRHYVGPTWEAADGSKVVGELSQKVDAPDGKGIPWLLLKAKSREGSGAFGKVTSIQRVNTVGGKAPPDGCDTKAVGTRQSISYQATYYFYEGHP